MGVTKPKPADFRDLARQDGSKPEFSVDWFSQHIGTWSKVLSKFKGKPRVRALEIGCFEGRATRWLLENILTGPGSKITVMDTFKGDPLLWADVATEIGKRKASLLRKNLEVNFYKNVMGFDLGLTVKYGRSQEALRDFPLYHPVANPKYTFDFAYLDGSHRPSDVVEDAVLVWPLLEPRGILIFDDYGMKLKPSDPRQPRIGIDCFLSAYKGRYSKIVSGYQMILRKEK